MIFQPLEMMNTLRLHDAHAMDAVSAAAEISEGRAGEIDLYDCDDDLSDRSSLHLGTRSNRPVGT